jgi:tetratricopeptide (TPR) repeat protein
MSDWFRNEEWSSGIEENFFRKLGCARVHSKPQYLRIQACYLSERRPEIALSLLDRYFELGDQKENAAAFVDRAQAYVDQAHAYDALGNMEQSAASFEKALLYEREFPSVITQAGFEFPLFVASHKMTNQYEIALQTIEKYRPKARFRWNGLVALPQVH